MRVVDFPETGGEVPGLLNFHSRVPWLSQRNPELPSSCWFFLYSCGQHFFKPTKEQRRRRQEDDVQDNNNNTRQQLNPQPHNQGDDKVQDNNNSTHRLGPQIRPLRQWRRPQQGEVWRWHSQGNKFVLICYNSTEYSTYRSGIRVEDVKVAIKVTILSSIINNNARKTWQTTFRKKTKNPCLL